ncbi:DUF4401 domain-containing protein [Pontibacter sp. KCTC 32443]|uniref:DUF4401 domain-containing protein n=1 Tax=Pontibacter TaxID=323449 RepID=UPI00164E89D9|nr:MULTISPECIES: DUF4401 domain-containing protein [Pontibacter]MBC5774259.1 DUF4401 domain-containing protein [Pontibacter sp. KCTC 32443]
MPQQQNYNLQEVLQTIQHEEGDNFSFDAAKIEEEAHFSSSLYTNLPIKLLTIFGGFLATGFFLGFLMTTGLLDSITAMFITGVIFLVASEVLNRLRNDLLLESMSVSLNIVGYQLFGVGFSEMTNDTALALALAGIALVFILVSGSTVLLFFATLVFWGSLISLPLIHELPELLYVHVGVMVAILTYLSLNEAKLIAQHPRLAKLYAPVRIGLVFAFIGLLIMLAHHSFLVKGIEHLWLASLLLIGVLLLVLRRIMQDTGVTDIKTQLIVYTCCIAILVPTILTPSLAGALLVVLVSFYMGHRLSFIVGLLALGYFIILYYYNLELTLLTKSGILVLTGCLFLGGLYLLNRYIRAHEK